LTLAPREEWTAAVKTGNDFASKPQRRLRLRSDYIATAAVVLAIVVSLAGAFFVIVQSSAEPSHLRHATLALP
jgi:hypothetical protein